MELPNEILVIIFKHLGEADRKSASETCLSWYVAANDNVFLKSKAVIFYKAPVYHKDISPLKIFKNSSVAFENYVFHDLDISNKMRSFWESVGKHIKNLTIRFCEISEKVFKDILEKCTNLETLEIINCNKLLQSGRLLEEETESLFKNNLLNLKALSLAENYYVTDAVLSRFISASPALQEIDISACSFQFNEGSIERIYPSGVDMCAHPAVNALTTSFVLKAIEPRAEKLKHFNLSLTLIDDPYLIILSKMKGLKLEKIILHCCNQITDEGIYALTSHQTSLKELDLSMCRYVTDESLLNICRELVNLEKLNIEHCLEITDLGIADIKKLTKLKSLNISQCENITKAGLEQGICAVRNMTLKELDINFLHLDETALTMILEKNQNLRLLNLRSCTSAVTDTTFQAILKNLALLETLNICYCNKISDVGLTGIEKLHDAEDAKDKKVATASDCEQKIHVGSKAEDEIASDSHREVEKIEKSRDKLSINNFSGHSLAQLKYLMELDLGNCNKITDISLTYAFKFKELKRLNLTCCIQITHEGMEQLVKNCPAIEALLLTDCYTLQDDAVVIIVQGLGRLEVLNLRGCKQLTEKTAVAIKTYCKKLKYLDLKGCKQISQEFAGTIKLPTLHTVVLPRPTRSVGDNKTYPVFRFGRRLDIRF